MTRWSVLFITLLTLYHPLVKGFSPRFYTSNLGKRQSNDIASKRKFKSHTTANARDERCMSQSGNNEHAIDIDLQRALTFSAQMVLCGAILGPFLDSYHSAFAVLQYDEPIKLALWGTESQPALTTAWWVPELFGVAGFIIGWLYIVLDHIFQSSPYRRSPSGPIILLGISLFTFQYWLSGALFSSGVERETILDVMSGLAAAGFLVLDNTVAGLISSVATAVGGPIIEIGLLSILGVYHYSDPGETGFFPLWIAPVYFLGGPAVGNLARGLWKLSSSQREDPSHRQTCEVCHDSRCVPCPNCDAQGYYVTYGRNVKCNACRGRGLAICRVCFSNYDEDPTDIEAIRDIMSRMPD